MISFLLNSLNPTIEENLNKRDFLNFMTFWLNNNHKESIVEKFFLKLSMDSPQSILSGCYQDKMSCEVWKISSFGFSSMVGVQWVQQKEIVELDVCCFFPHVQPTFGMDGCPCCFLKGKEGNDDEKQRSVRKQTEPIKAFCHC